jgi:hypothetical protein
MRSKICSEARVGYPGCTCDPESERAGMGGPNRPPRGHGNFDRGVRFIVLFVGDASEYKFGPIQRQG